MEAMSAALYDRLAARLGPKGWTRDAQIIAPHLNDWRGRPPGATPFLALPATTEEVAATVKLCADAGAAITPQGGNTGLVGGQIPQGEVLLSLKRLNRIRSVDPIDDALVAEAGVVLAHVQDAAAEADRRFPLSLASEGSATIGGLLSTNAGGVHVVRYGMMRDLTLGLEVVLADGRVLDALKALRKDNTGYDLKQLFIGAEGTLGIITAASLKLFPRPRGRALAAASVASAARALQLLEIVKTRTGALAAFEIMNRCIIDMTLKNVPNARAPLPGAFPYLALIEFEAAAAEGLRDAVESALGEALEAGVADGAVIAESEGQAQAFWFLREMASAGHKPEGAQINCDISVPVSRIPQFLETAGAAAARLCPGVRIVAFGHAGDGNIHYSLVQPEGAPAAAFPAAALSEAAHDAAHALGGSISAEHGIGVTRKSELPRYKSEAALAVMRTVKAALDPKGVFNPRALI
ncbi:MAG: FAD-binding protein [Alphaproteobacteria bacterium]|nr:FAD-binding protein [Alphaproteobacteria bacterium]